MKLETVHFFVSVSDKRTNSAEHQRTVNAVGKVFVLVFQLCSAEAVMVYK